VQQCPSQDNPINVVAVADFAVYGTTADTGVFRIFLNVAKFMKSFGN
jgi:hypothetical protein